MFDMNLLDDIIRLNVIVLDNIAGVCLTANRLRDDRVHAIIR